MKRAFSFGDKSLDAAVRRVNDVKSVAVIGAGTMGQGIAIDLIQKTDYALILLDVQSEALDRAKSRFDKMWDKQAADKRLRSEDAEAFKSRVTYTSF